jgi:hypothetical protein
MTTLTHSHSIVIARSPEDLYDLLSDIKHMGSWSPVARSAGGTKGLVPNWGHDEMSDRIEPGRPDLKSLPPIEFVSSRSW